MTQLPWIAHADWSVSEGKRWVAYGEPSAAGYVVHSPEPVGDAGAFLARTSSRAVGRTLIVGFDFPIGLPAAYALKAGIETFPTFLKECASGLHHTFFDVADSAQDIGLARPFYPRKTRGCSYSDLTQGLGLERSQLLRRCERKTATRPDACALFWTLGGNQVGRGALNGWRTVLIPALAAGEAVIWPFDGLMAEFLASAQRTTIVVETYPADAVRQLVNDPLGRWSKRKHTDRQRIGPILFPAGSGITPVPALQREVEQGFGEKAEGEDRFDAVAGAVALCQWALRGFPHEPTDSRTRHVEGWIAGQEYRESIE